MLSLTLRAFLAAVTATLVVAALSFAGGSSQSQSSDGSQQQQSADGTWQKQSADGTQTQSPGGTQQQQSSGAGQQQSSGPGGSLSVQAHGRPHAGRSFTVNVAGSAHTCSATVGGRALRSTDCSWTLPRGSRGQTLTIAVAGGGSHQQMSWRIR
jgi:hypothetical protein